ncbi:hypothetical protein MATL_G00044040 [Megalops atlanticus]|uniref:SCAN box domain-containing protein n=1 Tax=Megalops atlanticus TaxID=7932 RepID=A0A9D3Q994_MEGAT|nr:hypothetical protein MATL_G00044040 [Megalops atlanticus]
MEASEEKDLSQFVTSMLGLQRHLLETLTAQGQQQSAAFASLLTDLSAKIDGASASTRLFLPSLTDEDDTVTYLSLFERAALTARLPKKQWASALASQLTGEAEVAFRAVQTGGDVEYQVLKAAVLDRGPLAEESSRTRFRSLSCSTGLGPRTLAQELEKAASGWLKPHKRSGAEILQCLVVEQFTAMLPDRTAEWVRAGRPADLDEAVKLAESHISLTGVTMDFGSQSERPVEGSEASLSRKTCSAGPNGVTSEMGQASSQRCSPNISKWYVVRSHPSY